MKETALTPVPVHLSKHVVAEKSPTLSFKCTFITQSMFSLSPRKFMIILVNKGCGHVLTLNMAQFRPYINTYINKKIVV